MFWLTYECFSILNDAFFLKSVISSHNSCEMLHETLVWSKQQFLLHTIEFSLLYKLTFCEIKCSFKFCIRYNWSLTPCFVNCISQKRCYMIYVSVLLMFISINVYPSIYYMKWLDYHYMVENQFKLHYPHNKFDHIWIDPNGQLFSALQQNVGESRWKFLMRVKV